MVKIVGRKSLGIQPSMILGVERDHNFLLASGLVASIASTNPTQPLMVT
jgi:DNA polymerase-3 subunit alpha